MTTTITHCVRGCTRHKKHLSACADTTCAGCEPRLADQGQLCAQCVDRLDEWLREIPDLHAMLPAFKEPATDRDRNPESKATARTQAPVPVRIDVIDLLDDRRGRHWLGLVPTADRRGTLGTLLAIGNILRTKRKLTTSVIQEAEFIRKSLGRLTADEAIADVYDELRILHRQLSEAVGIHPARAVGVCARTRPNSDQPCGGQIMPNDAGGAHCRRCNADWNQDQLRFLGTLMGGTA